MTDERSTTDSPQLQVFKRFAVAMCARSGEAMLAEFDPELFKVYLPGHKPPLSSREFEEFFLRMNNGEFEHTIDIVDFFEREGTLVVMYETTYTSPNPAMPVRHLSYLVTAWVTFRLGKIMTLRLHHDRSNSAPSAISTYGPK